MACSAWSAVWLSLSSSFPCRHGGRKTLLSTVGKHLLNGHSSSRNTVVNKSFPGLIDCLRFSPWTRLIRTTSYCFRFVSNIRRGKSSRTSGPLKTHELRVSERFWLRKVQQESFPETIAQLRKIQLSPVSGKSSTCEVKPSNPSRRLAPFLDQDDILHVGGRLTQSALSYGVKHPALLPRRHHVTSLVIRHYHTRGFHVRGINGTLADVRQRFWNVHGREAIKEWEKQCQQCKRIRQRPASQPMAPLPSFQVGSTLRCFEAVGIDFAGPFTTKITRRVSAKRYLCLFACLKVRAVHYELVYFWTLLVSYRPSRDL